MKPRLARLFVLLTLAALLPGCQDRVRRGRSLTVSPTPHSLDLPVPNGFRLLSLRSEGSPVATTRHKYVGWADRDAVRDFYRSEMPLVRWRALDSGVAKDRYLLLFDRGDETCRIRIVSAGVFSFGKTIVEAQISRRTGASSVE